MSLCGKIARLKTQLSEQENNVKAQSKELEQLRSEMEKLRKEETDYKQKVKLSFLLIICEVKCVVCRWSCRKQK